MPRARSRKIDPTILTIALNERLSTLTIERNTLQAQLDSPDITLADIPALTWQLTRLSGSIESIESNLKLQARVENRKKRLKAIAKGEGGEGGKGAATVGSGSVWGFGAYQEEKRKRKATLLDGLSTLPSEEQASHYALTREQKKETSAIVQALHTMEGYKRDFLIGFFETVTGHVYIPLQARDAFD